MDIHFLNVGLGNMTLILMPTGTIILYDCNITNENNSNVMSYMESILGKNTSINIFINSHRDADHIRGIKSLHESHPIQTIWDSGVPGTTTDSPEYIDYMDLRRSVGFNEVEARKYWTYGEATLRCLNSSWPDYSVPNQQSIVLKVEYVNSSVMLAGDTDYLPWKEKILTYYSEDSLSSSLMLAAHHGSLTFFDDPADANHYYTDHIKAISPAMTLVSVGPNSFGLPDKKALEIYENYSSGSDKGNKLFTTEEEGNIRLTLKDEGGWLLLTKQ